ncbi:hypothetical protein PM082_006929 [Marasmius tenuissimus]|nr:hypothetical protein PM082_006929 [Marasmius tenuissimus]
MSTITSPTLSDQPLKQSHLMSPKKASKLSKRSKIQTRQNPQARYRERNLEALQQKARERMRRLRAEHASLSTESEKEAAREQKQRENTKYYQENRLKISDKRYRKRWGIAEDVASPTPQG